MWCSPLLELHFVLQADKRGVFTGNILPRVALSVYQYLIDTVWIHLFPPELASESVTLLSMTWSVLLRPWGLLLLSSCPKTQPPRWAGGHAQLPHRGVTAALGNKALWLPHPPENFSLSVCVSCSLMKQIIFCCWWLRNTSLLCECVLVWFTDNQCLQLLLSVHVVS